MTASGAEGVLITGVYGSGMSLVAAGITYLLEQRGEPYALLDLDYLGWASAGSPSRESEVRLMLANLTAVATNYRLAGIGQFVLAWFARDADELQAVRKCGRPAARYGSHGWSSRWLTSSTVWVTSRPAPRRPARGRRGQPGRGPG
jgi:hypothetical protein